MKNKEKYAKEIVDITIDGHRFAYDMHFKRVVPCNHIQCFNCLFHGKSSCRQERLKWANSEYKEKKEFSEADKLYVRAMDKLNWFARDKDGEVWGFFKKPFKYDYEWRAKNSQFKLKEKGQWKYKKTIFTIWTAWMG